MVFLLLPGCIGIKESININKDRSGTIKYSVSLSGSQELPGWILNLAGAGYTEMITTELTRMATTLRDLKGISNVHWSSNGENGGIFIEWHFDNLRDLNRSIYEVMNLKKELVYPGYIRMGCGRVKKTNLRPVIQYFRNRGFEDYGDELPLQWIEYESEITIPYRYTRVQSGNHTIITDNHTVNQKLSAEEVMSGEVNTGFRVAYSKRSRD
ncbi:MAG: hypothetical protein Kow00127_20720 [Bacteroidales bacterium]